MIELARHILALGLAGAGLFFMLVAAIGVVRMPDLFMRMHAATKASTLGISGIALAALVYFADAAVTTRVLLIILFFFLTGPVGTHALARSAYHCGVEVCSSTRRFDLERARILCPTRGGPPSQVLHDKAIALARESMGDLTFLYVINRQMIEAAGEGAEAERMLNEIRTLGQSVVSAAQAQARTQGVVARGEVRIGEPREEILRLAKEIDASLVVLGYPEMDQAAEQHAAEEGLWALTEEMQARTGAEVIIAR